MTRGIKKEKTLCEEVMELDSTLLRGVRQNLAVAGKLKEDAKEDGIRERLSKFLGRHALLKPEMEPKAEEKTNPTDRERRLLKLEKHLHLLPDMDLSHVIELVKSLVRKVQAPKARKNKKAQEGEIGAKENLQGFGSQGHEAQF